MSMKGFVKGGVLAAMVAVGALWAQPASAQELGKLNIVGTVDIFQVAMGGGENVVIDFLPPSNNPIPGDGAITARTGNTGVFAGIALGTPGTNIDFVFGPGAVPPSTTTPVDFLTIGGFTFTATSFGAGSTLPGYPFDVALLSGVPYATLSIFGTVTGPGITGVAQFRGSYSTQFPEYDSVTDLIADIEAGTVVPSSISASFVVTAIPEPSTYALMATGLLLIAGVGFRRRTS